MKIRYDFVTNSSSTSFIIINDGEFNFKTFTEELGIKDNSAFLDVFRELFYSFQHSMQSVEDYYKKNARDSASFEEFINDQFATGTYEKIIAAQKDGKKVYAGSLSSDHNDIESFFCTDSFIIETKKMYVDGTIDGW